jgi:hypothetical protein
MHIPKITMKSARRNGGLQFKKFDDRVISLASDICHNLELHLISPPAVKMSSA